MPSHFSGVIRPLVYILVAWTLTGSGDHSAAAEEGSPSENEPWQVLDVPNAWKTGAGGAYTRGIFRVWFRAAVLIPKDWKGRDISVFFEGADDAREIYFNGKLSGKLGEFPPNYRSGLGKTARFSIPPNSI